jgi:hypothetical protein
MGHSARGKARRWTGGHFASASTDLAVQCHLVGSHNLDTVLPLCDGPHAGLAAHVHHHELIHDVSDRTLPCCSFKQSRGGACPAHVPT